MLPGPVTDLYRCLEQRQTLLGKDFLAVLPGAQQVAVKLLQVERIMPVKVVKEVEAMKRQAIDRSPLRPRARRPVLLLAFGIDHHRRSRPPEQRFC